MESFFMQLRRSILVKNIMSPRGTSWSDLQWDILLRLAHPIHVARWLQRFFSAQTETRGCSQQDEITSVSCRSIDRSVLEHIGSRAHISQQQCCMELTVVHFAAHSVAGSQMVEKSLTWSRRDLYFLYADFFGVECRDECCSICLR